MLPSMMMPPRCLLFCLYHDITDHVYRRRAAAYAAFSLRFSPLRCHEETDMNVVWPCHAAIPPSLMIFMPLATITFSYFRRHFRRCLQRIEWLILRHAAYAAAMPPATPLLHTPLHMPQIRCRCLPPARLFRRRHFAAADTIPLRCHAPRHALLKMPCRDGAICALIITPLRYATPLPRRYATMMPLRYDIDDTRVNSAR